MSTQQDPRLAKARVLALEVALLEAEVDLMARLITAGIIPPGARREPTGPELRAGVRFAELDRIVNDTAALVVRRTQQVRDHVLDGLAGQLAGAFEADPWEAFAVLDELADPTSPRQLDGLRTRVAEVAAEVEADLIAAAQAGHGEALDEARRQGIPDVFLPTTALDTDAVTTAARAHAQRVAKEPASRLLKVAAEAAQRAATVTGATGADVLTAALDAAENASPAGVEDLARQGANVTHGLGRTAAQATMPTPREVYASELLDSSTCGPCATVDGRTYESLEAALVDYPGAGGYIGCDGGSRCRGTLVLVHSTEAPPTLNNPGDGRPGGPPVDRTPQGPSNPGRPAWIDEAGNLIPTPVDKGAATTTALTGDDLDTQGRTVVPVEHLEPTVDPVAPGDVDRDPELAEWEDHHLEQLLADDTADIGRRMAAADELDQRAAGTRAQVFREEALDAETLAAYETEREAWEKAGGYAAQAATSSTGTRVPGRRVDAVRAEWADQLHMDYLAAEDATRGTLIRRDRYDEFVAKYGTSSAALFEGPSRIAYYYASRELRDHWDTLPKGRQTFAEFAVDRGVADAKMTARARTAAAAREDARNRADESAAGQEKRAKQRAEKARRRGPLTAGERLARDQRRRDRIRAAERKNAADLAREAGPIDLPTPPPPAPVAPVAPPAPARAFTPDELVNALSPERKRTAGAILKELNATPAGSHLATTIKAFTETRGGVANLRKNITKVLDGAASSPVAARTRAFLDAMNTYPAEAVPTLYRGIAVHVEENTAAWWDTFEAQFAPGSTIDLNASSFTSSERKAAEFERMIGGTRKASGNHTAVRFVLEDAHALPVERLSKFQAEREWITGGEFEVTEFEPATQAQPYARVVIRQRKGIEAP